MHAVTLKLYLAARLCLYVMLLHPAQNWQEGVNLQLTWHPSQHQQYVFFP